MARNGKSLLDIRWGISIDDRICNHPFLDYPFEVIGLYAEYGAVGIIVVLFAMMIINLIKSQKLQNEDLDGIRQSIVKAETKMANVEGIVLKMLDRWNRSDEVSQRHREDIVKELNDVTDDLAYLKGRINGK